MFSTPSVPFVKKLTINGLGAVAVMNIAELIGLML